MQGSADNDQPITGINVTPLVDIILVVLIIFMATAPLIQRRAIKVDVPDAAYHERAAMEALSLVLNERRELFLAGQALAREDLAAQLARRVAAAGGIQVTVSADKGIPYGEIVGLLDLVRSSGVRRVSLEVRGK